MWKGLEATKPVKPPPATDVTEVGVDGSRAAGLVAGRDVVKIGKSVLIKGELCGSEDLTIEGRVEGKIELKQHVLTIGPHGRIKAQVSAKVVVVLGEVLGNIEASDKVTIRDSGVVEGDIVAPRVAIAEGARFRGMIDMQQGQGASPTGEEQPLAPGQAARVHAAATAGEHGGECARTGRRRPEPVALAVRTESPASHETRRDQRGARPVQGATRENTDSIRPL